MSEVVINLKSGDVVDRSKLSKLPADEMAKLLESLYSKKNANVVIVDNPNVFFSDKNLFEAIRTGSAHVDVIFEKRGLTIDAEDRFVIQKFIELNARVANDLAALVPTPPPYAFADIPAGWSVETKITIGKNYFRRSVPGYTIGHKALEKLWGSASKFWADQGQSRTYGPRVKAGGYSKGTIFYGNYIEIGCQKIERYEIEQVALRMGWAFPEPSGNTED